MKKSSGRLSRKHSPIRSDHQREKRFRAIDFPVEAILNLDSTRPHPALSQKMRLAEQGVSGFPVGLSAQCEAYRSAFTPEQEFCLQLRRAGDLEARQSMIEHTLRLVVSIAKPILGWGVPLPDLLRRGT
jgi:DNA-directed RNA polymerase sigma subunit (sigma70/sigma32)